jgi:hypothetical protein
MIYSVQIVESRVVETPDGESGSPSHILEHRFSTIPQAEDAGNSEIKRLRDAGTRAYYNVLDQDGRPVGPTGPFL